MKTIAASRRARETELGRRLMEIPGVGPLLASAIVATVPDPAMRAMMASGERDRACEVGKGGQELTHKAG